MQQCNIFTQISIGGTKEREDGRLEKLYIQHKKKKKIIHIFARTKNND